MGYGLTHERPRAVSIIIARLGPRPRLRKLQSQELRAAQAEGWRDIFQSPPCYAVALPRFCTAAVCSLSAPLGPLGSFFLHRCSPVLAFCSPLLSDCPLQSVSGPAPFCDRKRERGRFQGERSGAASEHGKGQRELEGSSGARLVVVQLVSSTNSDSRERVLMDICFGPPFFPTSFCQLLIGSDMCSAPSSCATAGFFVTAPVDEQRCDFMLKRNFSSSWLHQP